MREEYSSNLDADRREEIRRPLYDWSAYFTSASLQSVRGLCLKDRKCVLKHGHEVKCWPATS